MRFSLICTLLFLTSCTALPQFFQASEDIADDTAIKIEVSKEAVEKKRDITISIDVINVPNK